MFLVHVPIQEQSFPILVWWRNSQHRQQVMLRVFKYEARNRVRGRELWQPAQGHGLGMISGWAAEPGGRHSQSGQSLLQNPVLAVRPPDQERTVGHSPRQRLN